jgi:hypothetical protein
MSAAENARRFLQLADEWPSGALVWHKANGERGVIAGHEILGDGAIRIVVSYGDRTDYCLAVELSATALSDNTGDDDGDDTGDAWRKQGE